MKLFLSWLLVLASCGIAAAQGRIPQLNDPVAGEQLAQELRSMAPATNEPFQGTLTVSRRGESDRLVDFRGRMVPLREDAWEVIYVANPPNAVAESVVIRHSAQPTVYIYRRGRETNVLSGALATNSFAGTDFALLDLGLEFFRWPTQILVTREMRKGKGCDVLESRPATTNLYSRVVSWIDQETLGLLMAEAYDARGELLKQFEVSGVKKVAGQWRVREMELRDRQTKSRTRLRFEFDEE